MPTGSGYGVTMGMKKEAAFRDEVTGTLFDRIPVIEEGLSDAINFIDSEALLGKAAKTQLGKGTIPISGTIKSEVRYTQRVGTSPYYYCGADLLIALAMGTVTWNLGAAGYNSITLKDDLDVFGGLAIDKQVSVWNFISTFVNKMTLEADVAGALMCSCDLLSHKLRRDGVPQGTTELALLTALGGAQVLFVDGVYRLGNQSAALGNAHRIGISKFKITLDNKISESTFTSPDNVSGHTAAGIQRLTIQPRRNGWRTVEVEFELPRYESGWGSQLESWATGMTALQIDAVFTSGTNVFNILIPNLYLTSVLSPVAGAEMYPQPVKAVAIRNGTQNAYMKLIDATTVVAEEFAVEMKNERGHTIFNGY